MAKHNVYVTLPNAELMNADAVISVFQDEKKFGTITISKGSIEWYPSNAKQPYKMSWTKFDKMIKEME